MKWLFENGTVLFLVVVAIAKILEALVKSRKTKAEHEADDPAAEQRRVQEVQEQIRRRIAERRAGAPTQPEPSARAPMPRPILRRAETTELPDPLGAPLRRVLEQVERKLQPAAPAPEPPPLVQHRRAELERQQQLADQMRALEEARAMAQRRAAHVADNKKADAESEQGILTESRARTLEDLRDPQALRRAFVLREVLGTPVGLR
jgi:hypothetical protein